MKHAERLDLSTAGIRYCLGILERLSSLGFERNVFDSATFPERNAAHVELGDAAWDLLHHLEGIREHIEASLLDGKPLEWDSELQTFYRDVLEPLHPKLKPFLARLFECEEHEINLLADPLDFATDRVSPLREPIKAVLLRAVELYREHEPEPCEEALADLRRLVTLSVFQPDEWFKNVRDLRAFATDRRLPHHVLVRLREQAQSFALGNYLSALAASRALLEYAVNDRGALFGVQPTSRVRTLRQVIEDLGEKLPSLRDRMHTVVDYGNEALHPEARSNLVQLPRALRALALETTTAVTDVLEVLYRPC